MRPINSILSVFFSGHIVWLFLTGQSLTAQYTDQINSNRPGASIGAFSVGKRVFHFEAGAAQHHYRHQTYNNSEIQGQVYSLSLRWGLFFDQLEINYEGSYFNSTLTSRMSSTPLQSNLGGLLKNTFGIKYLLLNPFKNPEAINVFSWKANNGFRLRDLIPAISLTAGVNLNVDRYVNPYRFGDIFSILDRPIFFENAAGFTFAPPFANVTGTLATQSHFLPKWVFVTNFSYTQYPNRLNKKLERKEYILTLTHNFNPQWSVYVEHQGIAYPLIDNDYLFRSGVAFLYRDNLHFDVTLGMNTHATPALSFLNLGTSFRINKNLSAMSRIQYNAYLEAKIKKRERRQERKRDRNREKVRRRLQERKKT